MPYHPPDNSCCPAAPRESVTVTAVSETGDQPLFCFRHPERETYVSCGRCDRPICTSCGMMGPVGLRCRDCGKPPRDPLTSVDAGQLFAGVAAALGAGTIGGFIGMQIGFLAFFIGVPIGALIGEAILRATGYKRGPVMIGLAVGGIVGGVLLAGIIDYALFIGNLGVEGGLLPLDQWLMASAQGAIVYIVAALIGALARIR
jgi:hypothetical protein